MAIMAAKVQFDADVYERTGSVQFTVVVEVEQGGKETDVSDDWAGQEFSDQEAAISAVAKALGITPGDVEEV